ncbi:MAG: cytochrome C [Methylococcales bacterium]|nr:cytochrome C [Methylococcales bacterium]
MKVSSIKKNSLFISVALVFICSQSFAEITTKSTEPLVAYEIMEEVSKYMQIISDAISREDWVQVKKTALQIANQRQPPFSEKIRIVAFIGTDLSRFKSLDAKKQAIAHALAESAARKDDDAVIADFAALENICLECHQIFLKPFQNHFYGEREEYR